MFFSPNRKNQWKLCLILVKTILPKKVLMRKIYIVMGQYISRFLGIYKVSNTVIFTQHYNIYVLVYYRVEYQWYTIDMHIAGGIIYGKCIMFPQNSVWFALQWYNYTKFKGLLFVDLFYIRFFFFLSLDVIYTNMLAIPIIYPTYLQRFTRGK
jgi:hypothetical protein